jgi:hypothetical protein
MTGRISDTNMTLKPVSVAVPPKSLDFSHSIAGIAGSSPAEGMDVCLLCVV